MKNNSYFLNFRNFWNYFNIAAQRVRVKIGICYIIVWMALEENLKNRDWWKKSLPPGLKNRQFIENTKKFLYQTDFLAILPTHELTNFTNFHDKLVKIYGFWTNGLFFGIKLFYISLYNENCSEYHFHVHLTWDQIINKHLKNFHKIH